MNTPPDFVARLIGLYNDAALSLMISVGHRTGLFDAMAGAGSLTSGALAEKAGLNERYVREWLGAMVTGRIVERGEQGYGFPDDHAAFLTRAASPNNLAVSSQFISVLGTVEDQIVRSFREGGGVPYCEYPRFHEVMAEESQQTIVAMLDEAILPLAPGLREKLRAGIDVLDVGCGSGRALKRLARLYPDSRFTGYDFCEDAVAAARQDKPDNLVFEVKDVTRLGQQQERFDLVTAFDAIHDQIRPDLVLAGIRRVLKPGGLFLMQDIKETSPLAPFLYTISCMHCMSVSLSAGGAGLGAMWGKAKALELLREAGFERAEARELDHDIMNYYYLAS